MESIVKKVFPNARITTDRFHVMKHMLEDLQAIRSRLKTKLKSEEFDRKKKAKEEWEKYVIQTYINGESKIDIITRPIH